MTAHGSKGLQADYVFLLNTKAYGMGFPSQIADAPICSCFSIIVTTIPLPKNAACFMLQ